MSDRVNKAVIMAAGLGNRMHPLTLTTPKPLVKVHGVPMIETIIDALLKNNISDIHIVVGYLKDQFAYLQDKFGVHLIENPYYETCNNISSLYVARDHLENAIILDGDQVIVNPNSLRAEFNRSGYNAVWTEETDEWLMTVKDGVVTQCSRTGGRNGWQLYSISRWNKTDGANLKKHVETEFMLKKNRQLYWDDIPLFCYPDHYTLGITEMGKDDVLEIDSFDELKNIDPMYSEEMNGHE